MKSLKGILFFRYAVAVTVVVAIIAVVLIFPLRSQMRGEKEEHLSIEARNLAALLRPYFLENQSHEIGNLLREVPFSPEERLTVIDSDGVVLGDSWADPGEMDNHAGRPEVKGALTGEETLSVRYSATVDKDMRYVAAPIETEDGVVGVARVAIEEGGLVPVVAPAWLIMVAGLVFLLMVLFGLTYWTQRTLSADLEEIGRGLEQIVVSNDLETMPQPELSELRSFAVDIDTIAGKARESYRLLESERDRLEAILVNINAGILVLGADRKAVLINPVAERILGVTREDALGRTMTEIHPAGAIDNAVEESFAGEDISGEITITSPRNMTLRMAASPIRTSGGGAAGVVCVLEDITSTRRLERMRKDFVANVSHELRTPVSNLRATLDAMMEGALEDEEASRRFIANLDRESDRLMRTIEDLLVLSHLESDEALLERQGFDLVGLLDEVISECADTAANKRVELEFGRPDGPMNVVGDRNMMGTAFANLLDNAVKYNKAGGEAEITLDRLDDGFVIRVRDTGIGIPAMEQDKVFERFYRVDRARSRETGGTGLGLSIVKHVVELHGGSVSVESTEGHGSTFSVTMPAS
ncbi:MAG: cell wall metabolism sensor histidine kinase WalK [Actinobacteria bacterium]|nr:cell wall metabolism sensor histidine kinase WalK [Planctomycetota bacterium]MBU4391067.1 cell wall metabolism sensor histidine kinase WalK [Actinomycetota bacterium]MBU4401512.1 cell wall metabolism sensor histidine kinase WalK [Actinomycetota bacterium]MBU4441297.1 cell wall metabolism sensor histidine kinase WalK [Actinomycetota bacterium]MCG2818277.1 cell wall metabolism sensor histidine kinase WalK [Actinomycetes bacterium]